MAGYRVKFIINVGTEWNNRAEYTRGGQPDELLETYLEANAGMNCALIKIMYTVHCFVILWLLIFVHPAAKG